MWETDSLAGWCSAILVSGPYMLRNWSETHKLDGCSVLPVSCPHQTLKSNSQSG